MAGRLSEAELNHILANREPYADATDLIAIRDERAAIAARLAEISSTKLQRVYHRTEIATLNAKDGQLGTAEISVREHVWASPVKSKVYTKEMQLRADAARQEPPAPPALLSNREVRSKAGFDKDAFVQARKARQAGRGKVALSAGIDDD